MRVVVKVGTKILTDEHGRLDSARVQKVVDFVNTIKKSGKQVVVVTSGAIGAGFPKLGYKNSQKLNKIQIRQAASAIGQPMLMSLYEQYFSKHGIDIGQILLTNDIETSKEAQRNAINTFNVLFEKGVVPIVNENDAVSTAEIGIGKNFGDNENLSKIVSGLISAEIVDYEKIKEVWHEKSR